MLTAHCRAQRVRCSVCCINREEQRSSRAIAQAQPADVASGYRMALSGLTLLGSEFWVVGF